MPVLEVHLVDGQHDPTRHCALLATMSERYADVVDAPIDRIRAFLTVHRPEHWVTGGVAATDDRRPAPYFTAIVLAGRPAMLRRRLMMQLTDALVDVLGVERDRVRGRIIEVGPEDWGG